MKSVVEKPLVLFDLISKVPYGFLFTFSAKSPRNRKKSIFYPEELTRLELKGMLYGPFGYIHSRRKLNKLYKAPASVQGVPITTHGKGNVAQ